jgi:hypothetical protein
MLLSVSMTALSRLAPENGFLEDYSQQKIKLDIANTNFIKSAPGKSLERKEPSPGAEVSPG